MSSLSKRIVPLLDRVLVRKMKVAERTAGGILIPEKSQEVLQQGEVLAVGPGDKDYKMTLVPGDTVVLPSFGGASVKVGDETVFLYRENEIPAKLRSE